MGLPILQWQSRTLATPNHTSWQYTANPLRFCVSSTLRTSRIARSLGDQRASQVADYNKKMQEQMQWDVTNPYEYNPERGIYFHEVFPRVICGSQPRSPDDVTALKKAGVGAIVSLQQDKDLHHWGVDIASLQNRARSLGISYHRCPALVWCGLSCTNLAEEESQQSGDVEAPMAKDLVTGRYVLRCSGTCDKYGFTHQVVDFDPHSLRMVLPDAVRTIQWCLQQPGRVYVHCTAGLGRAPGACIAHSFWYSDQQLEEAYKALTDIRPCGPKKCAIRAATYDLLDDRGFDAFDSLPPVSYSILSPEQKDIVRGKLA